MRYAKEKRSGAEIPASKAVSGRTYACPNCGEEVFLRSGTWRAWHFAHRSGRADPECDLYYPGSAIGSPLSARNGTDGIPTGGERARIEPLFLGLRVEVATAVGRGDKRRWRLVLVLPKAPTTYGRIRVATGFSYAKELKLFSLSQSQHLIDVSPNAVSFGPEWISDEVDFDYRSAISERLRALAHDRPHAFAASDSKVKAMTPVLTWGDSYFLIWKLSDLAVPAAISVQGLAPYEGWSAALVTLPDEPLLEITEWLHQFGLKMLEAKRQWGVIYPPPMDIDLEGSIVVSQASHVVLGFVETKNSEDHSSTLSIATAATRYDFSAQAGKGHVLEIVRDEIDAKGPLSLQWDQKHLPDVVAAPRLDALNSLPAVNLVCQDTTGGPTARYVFHSADARLALERIRHGQAILRAVTVPRGVVGLLEQRHHNGLWLEAMSLRTLRDPANVTASWALSETQLSELVEVLSDVSSDVKLSFSIFGDYSSPGYIRCANPDAILQPDTRRRIIWYCRANGLGRIASSRVIELATDAELLDIFRRTPPRPHLVAHQNLLVKRLRFTANASDLR